MCKFSKSECPYFFGDRECPYLHRIECPTCKQPIFQEMKPHLEACRQEKEAMLLATERTSIMDCVICFETVIQGSKGSFALLVCDHCVCYECASSWRTTNSQDNSKACPICRQITRFIVPSRIWPVDAQAKEELILAYKEKLSKVDCRVYDKGRGTCSFGTSCFYRHVDKNGISEKDRVRLISTGDFDEQGLKVMEAVTLFDHLKLK
jgi:E3 ubiquitin-protein ligase makorin